jgi:flagellar biosynthesis/type III secretory pathway protein FliH
VKLHTPAGGVRIVRSRKPDREKSVPKSGEQSERNDEPRRGETAEFASPTVATTGQIVHSTIDEFEERLKAEFKAGFDEGRRHAEKHLRDDLTKKLAENQSHFESFMHAMREDLKRFQASAERTVVRLALAIADKIVKRETMMDGEIVLRQIGEAVKRIVGIDRIKIRVHPKDEEIVREYRTNILSTSDAVRELVPAADASLKATPATLTR